MAEVTLIGLHAYLKLLEKTAELKRRMPTAHSLRTLKEGLADVSRLGEADPTWFKDPRHIAVLIGAQRFVMIGGEPSATDQVVRIFDGSRALLTLLVDLVRFTGTATGNQGPPPGNAPGQLVTKGREAAGDPSNGEPPADAVQAPLDSLRPLLAGNTPLLCQLFRVLFEHLLGFGQDSTATQGGISLVTELTGSREHSRSFVATALFLLGREIDRDNLVSFMMQRGLFGIPVLEHLVQNREYCNTFHAFRRLERAFIGSPEQEEARLRNRLDQFNGQFGAEGCREDLFEAESLDKGKVDAFLAAVDLLDAMVLTPWRMSLNTAVSKAPSHSIRCVTTIAGHFERFTNGEITREQANREIGDHLLAFGRQFSADSLPAEEA